MVIESVFWLLCGFAALMIAKLSKKRDWFSYLDEWLALLILAIFGGFATLAGARSGSWFLGLWFLIYFHGALYLYGIKYWKEK